MTFRECAGDGSHTTEMYRWRGPPGFGLSVSSNRAVLKAAGQLCLLGHPIDPETVIRYALQAERGLANGRAIAADDVVPIVRGGVGEVHTRADGHIDWVPIQYDPAWIRNHILYAYSPSGERHDIPGLLERLFTHRRAGWYVTKISQLAQQASTAVQRSDLEELAQAVSQYVSVFDDWTGGRLINEDAGRMAAILAQKLGNRLCSWKPPGGGAASSLIAIVHDEEAMAVAFELLRDHHWAATAAVVAPGLLHRELPGGEAVSITAHHRLDLVGAADLGQDPAIQTDGICCSMAIEPFSELRLEFVTPTCD